MALGGFLLVLLAALPVLVGFDLSRHSVPAHEILAGGPPKDGIPAIDYPKFVPAPAAAFLRPDDRVVGVAHQEKAKAYPLRILNWHEVVNDVVGDLPVAVTYCPLTASAIVYERAAAPSPRSFGVSGLLYQSNLLLYDRRTESLWSQLAGEAIAGRATGSRLRPVAAVETSWEEWRRSHPDTLVLAPPTDYPRDYDVDPYRAYRESPDPMFPVTHVDLRLPAKAKVAGLRVSSASKAYPLSELSQRPVFEDSLGGLRVRIDYDAKAERVLATEANSGRELPAVLAYWFAWAAFHRDTEIWIAGKSDAQR